MRKDISQVEQITRRIASKDSNWAFGPQDFSDIGDTRSIGMALTRLKRGGTIRRIAQGLYDKPHHNPVLGTVGASMEEVINAIVRKKHIRVLPSAAVAANKLGLTTQVPAKMVYHTDGAPTDIQLGNLRIQFKRNAGRTLALAGRSSGLVAQALRHFGKDGVHDEHIQTLRTHLSDAQKKQLAEDIAVVPSWMRPHFKHITETREDA